MIARTRAPTPAMRAIGPQLRLELTLTGAIGLRPFGPFPAGRLPGLPPPGGLGPAAVAFLPVVTVDGFRSPPGMLTLIVPRQVVSVRSAGPTGAIEQPRAAAECRS